MTEKTNTVSQTDVKETNTDSEMKAPPETAEAKVEEPQTEAKNPENNNGDGVVAVEADKAEVEPSETETAEGAAAETEPEVSSEVSVTELKQALEEAQTDAAKNLEGWQRTAADLANFKRRQAEQMERSRADIISSTMQGILPALDDLDLAFQNLPETLSEQEANWVEGFRLVQRKLFKVLETYQVETIKTEGKEFDPNLHEAVTYEESANHESNTIIAEIRKGYKTGDRILRPALVRVAQ